jgi:hypothetical protein
LVFIVVEGVDTIQGIFKLVEDREIPDHNGQNIPYPKI